tara:strand:- start:390 stop:980 length:591 start_codon:yes stop_codon:yes gene_type:complete
VPFLLSPRLRLFWATALALLLLYPGSTSGDAGAHGGGTEIFRGVDGPFVIAVRILPLQPLVGKLHLTVTVDLLETGESVGDARVRVTGHHQNGGATPQFSPALNVPTDRRFYDANFDIEDAGTWDFVVEVETDDGKGSVQAPVSIIRRTRSESLGVPGTMMFILVSTALFGGGGWIAYTARKNHRKRRERNRSVNA